MPITMTENLAVFEDNCAVEEAEALLDWLRRVEHPLVDLSGCTHIHAAVLQTLLALHPGMVAAPTDSFLAQLLAGLPSADPQP